MKFIFLFIFLSLSFSSSAFEIEKWKKSDGRFLMEGDGKISFQNEKTSGVLTLDYRQNDGSYSNDAIQKLNQIFYNHTQTREENISLGLIALLDWVQDTYAPNKTLILRSGYRSPTYNQNLRNKGRTAAPTSYHMEGMAADILIKGMDYKIIWEEMRHLNCCGVGIYSDASLHLDTGRPRFWDQNTALPVKPEPILNRNIYAQTDKDIYLENEKMQIYFTGISDYPFGISETFEMFKANKKMGNFKPDFSKVEVKNKCLKINSQKQARLIFWNLNKLQKLKPSKKPYHFKTHFCDPTYEKMPKSITSREFYILD